LLFLRRYLASPSRKLLLLPAGAMAILIAAAGLVPPVSEELPSAGPLLVVHIVFMTAALAAHLVGVGSGLMYLIAVRQLKAGSAMALRMPALPNLDRLCERSVIIATGLLLGGLASGGVAMQTSTTFSLSHPAAVLALLDMGVLVLALALRTTGHLGRRGVATAAIVTGILLALASTSFIALRHG
jgi:hypothetical protein